MIDGVLYRNDGDWIESPTALVEHGDGRLEIMNCAAGAKTPQSQRAPEPSTAEVAAQA